MVHTKRTQNETNGMKNRLADNLKLLRAKKGLTQAALAERFELNRSTVSAWEDGRAEPRVAMLLELANYFEVSLDELIYADLPAGGQTIALKDQVRVLPIAVDADDANERISVVPVKAAAGYLSGFGDLDFIASLPTFRMPVNELPQDLTLRMFQIEGDSMLPIRSGSYILASYVEDLSSAGNRHPYVAVTRNDGIVFKRIENQLEKAGLYRMISDNPEFKPYSVKGEDVLELWRARAYVSFNFDPAYPSSLLSPEWADEVSRSLARIEESVKKR